MQGFAGPLFGFLAGFADPCLCILGFMTDSFLDLACAVGKRVYRLVGALGNTVCCGVIAIGGSAHAVHRTLLVNGWRP